MGKFQCSWSWGYCCCSSSAAATRQTPIPPPSGTADLLVFAVQRQAYGIFHIRDASPIIHQINMPNPSISFQDLWPLAVGSRSALLCYVCSGAGGGVALARGPR